MGKKAGAGGGGGGGGEGGGDDDSTGEGQNLLGPPTFKELESGRFKCVETGHELPAHARDTYTQSKHCRLGLIDAALVHNKPPLNMFRQDPQSRVKLICKLTGVTINKSEEHIWKHINGKRFLNMLERMETEKRMPNGKTEEQDDQKERKKTKTKDGLKKKKKKQDEPISEVISEVRDVSKDSDSEEEEDFWMPPVGERWDDDDGGDRWGSCSESGAESDDVEIEANAETEEVKQEAGKLSRRTKRMSLEVGPSSFASRKKKKNPHDKSMPCQVLVLQQVGRSKLFIFTWHRRYLWPLVTGNKIIFEILKEFEVVTPFPQLYFSFPGVIVKLCRFKLLTKS